MHSCFISLFIFKPKKYYTSLNKTDIQSDKKKIIYELVGPCPYDCGHYLM